MYVLKWKCSLKYNPIDVHALKKIHLQSNNLDDKAAVVLADVLDAAVKNVDHYPLPLQELDVRGNPQITIKGARKLVATVRWHTEAGALKLIKFGNIELAGILGTGGHGMDVKLFGAKPGRMAAGRGTNATSKTEGMPSLLVLTWLLERTATPFQDTLEQPNYIKSLDLSDESTLTLQAARESGLARAVGLHYRWLLQRRGAETSGERSGLTTLRVAKKDITLDRADAVRLLVETGISACGNRQQLHELDSVFLGSLLRAEQDALHDRMGSRSQPGWLLASVEDNTTPEDSLLKVINLSRNAALGDAGGRQFIDSITHQGGGSPRGITQNFEDTFVSSKGTEMPDKISKLCEQIIPRCGGRAIIFVRKHWFADVKASLITHKFTDKRTVLFADDYDLPKSRDELRNFHFDRTDAAVLLANADALTGHQLPDCKYVINFDLPDTLDEYHLRIRHAGRMGQPGTTISLMVKYPSEEAAQIPRYLLAAQQETQQFRLVGVRLVWSRVKEIRLSRCGLGSPCATRIAELLPEMRSLNQLDLSGNFIQQDGALQVAKALPDPETASKQEQGKGLMVLGQNLTQNLLFRNSVNLANNPFVHEISVLREIEDITSVKAWHVTLVSIWPSQWDVCDLVTGKSQQAIPLESLSNILHEQLAILKPIRVLSSSLESYFRPQPSVQDVNVDEKELRVWLHGNHFSVHIEVVLNLQSESETLPTTYVNANLIKCALQKRHVDKLHNRENVSLSLKLRGDALAGSHHMLQPVGHITSSQANKAGSEESDTKDTNPRPEKQQLHGTRAFPCQLHGNRIGDTDCAIL